MYMPMLLNGGGRPTIYVRTSGFKRNWNRRVYSNPKNFKGSETLRLYKPLNEWCARENARRIKQATKLETKNNGNV